MYCKFWRRKIKKEEKGRKKNTYRIKQIPE